MFHPDMLERLIIVNGAHPFISERELRENPAQRYASNYFFVFNKFLAPGEQPVNENDTKEGATRRAHAGFVDAEVKAGRYTEEDRQAWIAAWSQPGSTTAGLNYYRANHRNAPFNDLHPASTIPTSWSAAEITKGAKSTIINVPTLVIWGMRDTAILSGHLSGLEKWVPNLSVRSTGRRPLGDAAEGGACRQGHPRLHRGQEFPERVGLSLALEGCPGLELLFDRLAGPEHRPHLLL
jgi:pimeloyl-ACP methyl ester carboxylesterase